MTFTLPFRDPRCLFLATITATLAACTSPHAPSAASTPPAATLEHQSQPPEHLIPYSDLMASPDNDPDITRQRGQFIRESAASLETQAKLKEIVPEFIVENARLDAALDQLNNATGTNIYVAWPQLQAHGIERDTRVSLAFREIPARYVLTLLLDQAAQAPGIVSYKVDEGLVFISSNEDLRSTKYQLIKVFDIRDLLATVPEVPDPKTPPRPYRRAKENPHRTG